MVRELVKILFLYSFFTSQTQPAMVAKYSFGKPGNSRNQIYTCFSLFAFRFSFPVSRFPKGVLSTGRGKRAAGSEKCSVLKRDTE